MRSSMKSYEVEMTVGVTVTVMAEDRAEAAKEAQSLVDNGSTDVTICYIDIESIEIV